MSEESIKTEVNYMYIKPALPVGENKTQHKDTIVYTHSVLWHFLCPSGNFFIHHTCLAVFNLFLHRFTFHQLCSNYCYIVQPLVSENALSWWGGRRIEVLSSHRLL